MYLSWGVFVLITQKPPFPRSYAQYVFLFFYTITQHLLQLESFLEITFQSHQGQSLICLLISGTIQLVHFTCYVYDLHVCIFYFFILSSHIHLTPSKYIHTWNLICHSNKKAYIHYLSTTLNKQRWRPAHDMIHLTTK